MLTKTAMKLAKDLNKEGNVFFEDKAQAIRLMEKISAKSMKGKTSDRIVDWLIQNESIDWVKILEKQMSSNKFGK